MCVFLCDVCVEANKPLVPASCCKKDQYGKYINQKMCQTWTLGPPFKQSSVVNSDNIGLFYKVFFITLLQYSVCVGI